MATAKGEVTLRGGFPARARVELHEKSGDWFPQQGVLAEKLADLSLGKPVAAASVARDSSVSFDGLEPGRPFWAVAIVDGVARARTVTAKVPDAPGIVADLPLGQLTTAPRKQSSAQSVAPGVNRGGKVTGSRTSRPRSQESAPLRAPDSTDLASQAAAAKAEAARVKKNAAARRRRAAKASAGAKAPAKKGKATTAKKPARKRSGSNRR